MEARYKTTLNYTRFRDTCHRLARESSSVVELGVRSVVSNWALLLRLYECSSVPMGDKSMVAADIERIDFRGPMQHGGACGMSVRFFKHDSATVGLPERDLLLIDTLHTYGLLKRELAAHAIAIRRYIVLHDTVVDAARSDVVYAWASTWPSSRVLPAFLVTSSREASPPPSTNLSSRTGSGPC